MHLTTLSAAPVRARVVLASLVVAFLLVFGMAAVTANASAATLTANVDTSVDGCPVRGSASYDTVSNVLTLDYYTRSPYWFAACRVKLITGFKMGPYQLGSHTYNVPTACALTDTSCASTVQGTVRFGGAFQPAVLAGYLDSITLTAAKR